MRLAELTERFTKGYIERKAQKGWNFHFKDAETGIWDVASDKCVLTLEEQIEESRNLGEIFYIEHLG